MAPSAGTTALIGMGVSAIGAGVGAYSAYQGNKNSQEANANAQKQTQLSEEATQNQTNQLDQQLAANQAKQQQDAQWFGMRQKAGQMAGLSTQAPGSLTSQSGSLAGYMAGTQAGKTLLGG